MSSEPTRREFLKLTEAGAAALATAGGLRAWSWSSHASPAVGNEVSMWVTDETQRLAHGQPLLWQSAVNSNVTDTVTLNLEKKFQDVLGFGAAFTDAACYTLNRLPTPARQELFHRLFRPSEMGLSVCRTCIGSSDYATKVYSYYDGEADMYRRAGN